MEPQRDARRLPRCRAALGTFLQSIVPKVAGYEPLVMSPGVQKLVVNGESFEVFSFKRNACKSLIFHAISISLLGVPYLVSRWFKKVGMHCKFVACPLKQAEILFIQSAHKDELIVEVQPAGMIGQRKFFIFQFCRFVWRENYNCYSELQRLGSGDFPFRALFDYSHGLTEEAADHLLNIYGENELDIGYKSYFDLFVEEVFNPFYIFQVASILLWVFDEYLTYASCILCLSGVSLISSLYQTKKQRDTLQNMIQDSAPDEIDAIRSRDVERVHPSTLVPGDVIIIPYCDYTMPCDAMLLSGLCVMNESMLTGECVPVTKTPAARYDETRYDTRIHKKCTLFAGTRVIRSSNLHGPWVTALVIGTGFSTAKGSLIQLMMFPPPMGFRFYTDSIKFLLVLFFVAMSGMALSIWMFATRGASLEDIIIRSLDLITVVVPPALPAAMTAGTIYSQRRLKDKGIFCISPPRINMCGKIKLACFDKTGTLTEDRLVFRSVVPSNNLRFFDEIKDPSTLNSAVVACMATCHTLISVNGQIIGDPLDVEMFSATKWDIEEFPKDTFYSRDLAAVVVRSKYLDNLPDEPKDGQLPHVPGRPFIRPQTSYPLWETTTQNEECMAWNHLTEYQPSSSSESDDTDADYDYITYKGPMPNVWDIGIIRQFPFYSEERCMTVITKTVKGPFVVYTKGAPDRIFEMCAHDAVPTSFQSMVQYFTAAGFRVIALGCRVLPQEMNYDTVMLMPRDAFQENITFLGLLILENNLKPETTSVIQELLAAKIRPVMSTGDNLFTAVSIARQCKMIEDGKDVIKISVEMTEAETFYVAMQVIDINDGAVHDYHQRFATGNETSVLDISSVCFAIEGFSWVLLQKHFPEMIPYVCTHGTVFARMSPTQKMMLVEHFKSYSYVVAMIGDGANDCGALVAADVGVSLSKEEASVAAPFTSNDESISCLITLIKEGRCALVTSFGLFRYMAMYSLIQFVTVMLLYVHFTMLGSMQFLFIDLLITTTLALVMGYTGPAENLSKRAPMARLMSLNNIVPLALQIVIMVIVQVAALYLLTVQPWYVPITPSSTADMKVSWENTTLFLISCFQYLILALIYTKGTPHRRPKYTNLPFVCCMVTLTLLCVILVVVPIETLASIFEICSINHDYELHFRLILLAVPLTHLVVAVGIERFIAGSLPLKRFIHCITKPWKSKSLYKCVGNEMVCNVTWKQPLNVHSM